MQSETRRSRGSGNITPKGYIRLYDKKSGRRRFEHTLVWERHNGPIPDGYQVHHKNEDKKDNRIENLELMTPLEHKREHSGCFKNADGKWVKPCRKCLKEKSVDENYYKRADGVGSWCKCCCVENTVMNKRKRRAAMLEGKNGKTQ